MTLTRPHFPVHPRACGERREQGIDAARSAKAVHPRACGERCGYPGAVVIRHTPVHPRACGEHDRVRGHASGSPPRLIRFIPARAGNGPSTQRIRWSCTCSPVHPRACGERRDRPGDVVHLDGSSPRVRGNVQSPRGRAPSCHVPVHPRACGERPPRRSAQRRPVHPRACGERGPMLTDPR